jgi:aminopeptidase N
MYYKGSNMLHTLRQLLEDDEKWRSILRGLNSEFYHQTVTSAQVEAYLSEKSGIDLTAFFDQYLRSTLIPKLEYKIDDTSITYRYSDVVANFDMPVRIFIGETPHWLFPTTEWKSEKIKGVTQMLVDSNFYITTTRL